MRTPAVPKPEIKSAGASVTPGRAARDRCSSASGTDLPAGARQVTRGGTALPAGGADDRGRAHDVITGVV
ncbi:hypothetical protein GCM10017559_74830 [Streptosporangium longisporum]|uniref:Uncharacterized protein n=1 Tax=Streptosporangium longisporum TaxID=46187 RepID=A0ABP6LCM8_9ACTN